MMETANSFFKFLIIILSCDFHPYCLTAMIPLQFINGRTFAFKNWLTQVCLTNVFKYFHVSSLINMLLTDFNKNH